MNGFNALYAVPLRVKATISSMELHGTSTGRRGGNGTRPNNTPCRSTRRATCRVIAAASHPTP